MPFANASVVFCSLARRLHRGYCGVVRRPVRSGLVVATVVLAAVMLMTMVALGQIGRQLNRQDALVQSMATAPVDDRSSLMASHLDVIADVRRLYAVFAAGMTTVLGLLFAAFWIAQRAAAARDTLHRQRIMMERSQDAILLLDAAGTIVDLNPAAEAFFGLAAGELIGRTSSDLSTLTTRAAAERAFTRAMEVGNSVAEDMRVTRADGSVAIADFSVIAVTGDRPMVIAIGRDVTAKHRASLELAQSQEQLRQAQKMEAIGLLAGGVAHDFNNALTVINGYTELILDALPAGAPHRDQLVQIGQAGERAAGITRQLLAFSRRDQTRLRIVELNAVIAGIARMLERLLGEDITLCVVPAPVLGRILADPGQIEQVLMNLAVNARDAMPDGGALTITTTMVDATPGSAADSSCVRLSVADTGCGMDAATCRRVFEPFFTTKPAGKGTGLGLSIVFGIVEGAGGVIAIDTAPGLGTTFHIDLPEVLADVTREASPEDAGRPGPSHGTVLLVEDELPLRECVRDALALQGYAVLEAEDGQSDVAVARGHRGQIDLVISDLVMPGLSMEEIYAVIKADRPGVALLCMSGHSDRARIHPLLMSGQVPYIEKPFVPSELVRLVHTLLPVDAGREFAAVSG